jgi:hypothetical protein
MVVKSNTAIAMAPTNIVVLSKRPQKMFPNWAHFEFLIFIFHRRNFEPSIAAFELTILYQISSLFTPESTY